MSKNMFTNLDTEKEEKTKYYVITDSCGLTRETKTYGEIHSACKIVKAQAIGDPIWRSYGNLGIDYEGDNIFTHYYSAENAIKAALEFLVKIDDNNRLVSEENKHMRINIGGIGISSNEDVAYTVGENYASKSIIITKDVHEEVRDLVNNFKISERFIEEEVDQLVVEIPFDISTFRSILENDFKQDRAKIRKDLLARYNAVALNGEDGVNEDKEIKTVSSEANAFMPNVFTILFDIAASNNGSDEPEFKQALETNRLKLIDKSLIFAQTVDEALEFAFSMRASFKMARFGIDVGEVLWVDQELRVGDCINTASKIGQDHTDFGQIVMTKRARDIVGEDTNLTFEESECEVSRVKIKFYYVSKPGYDMFEGLDPVE